MPKNRVFWLLCILCITIITVITFCLIQINDRNRVINNLEGTIIYVNPRDKQSNDWITFYNFKTKKQDFAYNFQIRGSDVCFETGKVISISLDSEIVEFGEKDKKVLRLFRNISKQESIMQVRYIPNNINKISVQLGEKLYIINTNNNQMTYLLGADNGFCWVDDKNIIYSYNGQIVRENIMTREKIIISGGYYPEISNDKQHLAFLEENNPKLLNKMVIYDLKNSVVEDRFECKKVFRYRFSPDGKYIAFTQEGRKNLFFSDIDINLLDCKTGKIFRLFNDIKGSDFVWIQ